MITYQDLLEVGNDERKRIDFVRSSINKHKGSVEYGIAEVSDEYNRRRNRTILQYQKMLYTLSGEAVPDNYSANYKLCSNFFSRFITQLNQFLLGNGVNWQNNDTEEKLGEDFDNILQDAGESALVQKVAFGFWNLDHLEVFDLLHFAPLWDEEDGSLKAGIRFWQIDDNKPLRATLYELDGYTQYIWTKDNEGAVYKEKQTYKNIVKGTVADGEESVVGENYPTFPIIPLWGNKKHQSEFVGMRENIDAYDLIKSGFANDLDDASQIYWIIQNAGGMDDLDLVQFQQRLKKTKSAIIDEDGAKAEAHTIEVPVEARERLLDRLRNDMYEDFMALDTKNIASGAVTATQIEASYEPLNQKADGYEYCVIKFVKKILDLAGIDDSPTFTRSMIVNTSENITTLIQSAEYLSPDYITEKILTYLGDKDRVDEVLKDIDAENMDRFGGGEEAPDDEEDIEDTKE